MNFFKHSINSRGYLRISLHIVVAKIVRLGFLMIIMDFFMANLNHLLSTRWVPYRKHHLPHGQMAKFVPWMPAKQLTHHFLKPFAHYLYTNPVNMQCIQWASTKTVCTRNLHNFTTTQVSTYSVIYVYIYVYIYICIYIYGLFLICMYEC